MKKKRVLIINQGKSENLGDKAINIILKDILEDNNCEVECAGYAQCTERNMALMSERLKRDTKSRLRKLLPNISLWGLKYYWNIKNEFTRMSKTNQYDLVIIGGGQLLKTKSVFVYALLTWYKLIKRHLKCPVVLLSVGADDKFAKLEKMIYKKILPGFNDIYVRDDKSKQSLFREFGITTKYIPDVVFAYSKYYPLPNCEDKSSILLMIYNYADARYNFGANHSIYEYYNSWKELLLNNVVQGSKIVLGYTTIEDKRETIKFAQYLKDNSEIDFIITDTDDINQFVEVLAKTKKVISGRMHALLLGMNYGCEPIPYIISSKISTFKKEWIDSETDIILTRKEIDDTVKKLLEEHSVRIE